jgi:hypothetical protein
MGQRPKFFVAVDVLVIRDGKILLGKRKGTYGEIAFWDDDVKNVESARLHGWQANHYTDFDKLVDWSNKL